MKLAMSSAFERTLIYRIVAYRIVLNAVRRGMRSISSLAVHLADRQAQGRCGPAAAAFGPWDVRAVVTAVQRQLQRRLQIPSDHISRGKHEQRNLPTTDAFIHELQSLLPGSYHCAGWSEKCFSYYNKMWIYVEKTFESDGFAYFKQYIFKINTQLIAYRLITVTECKKLQFIHTVNGDGSKTAKVILKGNVNHTNIDIQAMLVLLALPVLMIFAVFDPSLWLVFYPLWVKAGSEAENLDVVEGTGCRC